MRPKVVIAVLIAAFVLLGAVALIKGLNSKNANLGAGGNGAVASGPAGGTTGTTETNSTSAKVTASAGTPVVSSELRAAMIEKEIEDIHDLQGRAEGTNNPEVIAALLGKMQGDEAQVRLAALEAIKELNDTNAVSGLQKAVDATKDAREKVAILDVIDFLNLPSATPDVPPDGASTNGVAKQEAFHGNGQTPRAQGQGQMDSHSKH
jgi:hypothetical protein